MQDFHFLCVKRIAVVTSEIAHSVDVQIVARRETANRQVVALRAAFARRETDTGYISQTIAQCRGALLLHRRLRHNVDSSRSVQQWLLILRHRGRNDGRCLGDLKRGYDGLQFNRELVSVRERVGQPRTSEELLQRLLTGKGAIYTRGWMFRSDVSGTLANAPEIFRNRSRTVSSVPPGMS